MFTCWHKLMVGLDLAPSPVTSTSSHQGPPNWPKLDHRPPFDKTEWQLYPPFSFLSRLGGLCPGFILVWIHFCTFWGLQSYILRSNIIREETIWISQSLRSDQQMVALPHTRRGHTQRLFSYKLSIDSQWWKYKSCSESTHCAKCPHSVLYWF